MGWQVVGTALGACLVLIVMVLAGHAAPAHDMSRNHGYYQVSSHCQWEYGHAPGQRSSWSVVCG